ncbi:MAG: LacI family DNA-binding transcriptional regulator [Planctomycetia bacterium]
MTMHSTSITRPRRVTIKQVAEEAGVARATAAFVISGRAPELRISSKTISRVQAVAKRLGYIPNHLARGMITGRTHVVGVVLGGVWGKFGQYAIEGTREVLDGHGYLPFLTVHSWNEDRERQEIETLMRMRVDGVIAMPQLTSRKDCYTSIIRQRIPLVFFGDVPFDMPKAFAAGWDPQPAMRRLLDHLTGLGCTRIGFVGERFFKYTSMRYVAFRKTLRELGLDHNPKWETWAEVSDPVDPGWGARFSKLRSRPDAIVALNDNCGLRMLHALRASGVRVPEDVRVACLGDTIETVEESAQLTAIREPVREIGRAAAQLLIEAILNPKLRPKKSLVESAELVVRPSTVGRR